MLCPSGGLWNRGEVAINDLTTLNISRVEGEVLATISPCALVTMVEEEVLPGIPQLQGSPRWVGGAAEDPMTAEVSRVEGEVLLTNLGLQGLRGGRGDALNHNLCVAIWSTWIVCMGN